MNNVNLLPQNRRAARQKSSRIARWTTVVTLFAIIAAVAGIGTRIWIAPHRAPIQDGLTRMDTAIRELNASIGKARKDLAESEKRAAFHAALRDQPDWSNLLALLNTTLPRDGGIYRIDIKPGGAKDTNATNAEIHLGLDMSGYCKTSADVTQWVTALQKTGLFESVRLARAGREPRGSETVATFQITCDLGREETPR